MDLVEVDDIQLQAAQTVIHLAADLQQGAPDAALFVPHHAAFSEDKGLNRRLLHRLADDGLRVAKAVDGRRVDPVDAEVDGLVDGRDRGVIVLRTQAKAQLPPPMAQAPNPIGVNHISVLPSCLISIVWLPAASISLSCYLTGFRSSARAAVPPHPF